MLKNASKLADKSLDDAIDYMNDYSLKLTDETIEEAKTIFNQLIWYITGHIETLRHKFSFDLFAADPEETVLEPFKPVFKK